MSEREGVPMEKWRDMSLWNKILHSHSYIVFRKKESCSTVYKCATCGKFKKKYEVSV